jgi:phosphoribosylformimino-5-aminoimidazole carboxamide ribotide isomerase
VAPKPPPDQRPTIDRRSGTDRRTRYSMQYFLDGGVERRKAGRERRSDGPERRKGWVRDGQWHSVYVGDSPPPEAVSTRFRPCIDLHGGRVKQIVGATLSDAVETSPDTNFESQKPAAWYARLYRQDDLRGGHVIQLGPGNGDAALEALAAWPGGLQIGGGITIDNAVAWLEAGAAAVIVTSWVFHDGQADEERLRQLSRRIGKERLVLDLSCRKTPKGYRIATDRWQNLSQEVVTPALLDRLAGYCSEYLVHAVDVEGQCSGIETSLLNLLAGWAGLPVTYAGGICSIADIETIGFMGRGHIDFTVGSALDIFGAAAGLCRPGRSVRRWRPHCHRRADGRRLTGNAEPHPLSPRQTRQVPATGAPKARIAWQCFDAITGSGQPTSGGHSRQRQRLQGAAPARRHRVSAVPARHPAPLCVCPWPDHRHGNRSVGVATVNRGEPHARDRRHQQPCARGRFDNPQCRGAGNPENDRRMYLGGKGLGLKLIYDRMPPGVDPLGADNIMAVMTGVLLGTGAPCSGRFAAVTKSPLTGLMAASSCGGPFGMGLKTAGYDGLLITGCADEPLVLSIDEQGARFDPAGDLWGRDTVETPNLPGPGPAGGRPGDRTRGENRVLYANIASGHRFLGRGGFGAVMGPRTLKRSSPAAAPTKSSPENPMPLPGSRRRRPPTSNAIRSRPGLPAIRHRGQCQLLPEGGHPAGSQFPPRRPRPGRQYFRRDLPRPLPDAAQHL